MTSPDVIANILGTIGTVLWCIQLTPQIYYLWKKKDATGFPPIFMFLWAVSGIPFSIYFVSSDSYIPLQIQPQLFTLLCSIAWVQSMYYPPYSYPKRKLVTYAVSFYTVALACELGFGIPLKKVYRDGTHWPMLVFGIIASVLLVLGLVPPYFELAKRQGRVVGINFFFLAMDSSGAIFSMASTCVSKIDIMAMILYILVIAMEAGIFLSQLIWLLRFRVFKETAVDDSDDVADEHESDADDHESIAIGSIEEGKAAELPPTGAVEMQVKKSSLKLLTHNAETSESLV
ncbi:DEKNAAC105634 [Brettanomyces naardenensis]|uniref:DEKNAAC105634 n=1 Tax=Brettanomyces naardenensis TaxID=13370 RepID=A0A448YTZ4_BRENA|nr:DEKNAAC105634 [Brettanomyces naardenensis]